MRSYKSGLIGRGISQSRSPQIHESEGRALGLDLTYRLLDFAVMNRDDGALGDQVSALVTDGYSGCNLTYPFKQEVIRYCSKLSQAAEALGAVNTLIFSHDGVEGDNTDWIGFAWLLERDIGNIENSVVAHIGAGGAGSATAYAIARSGAARVVLFDPAEGRAIELAARLSPHFPKCRFDVVDSPAKAIEGADGVVNATPVGMVSMPGLPFDPSCMTRRQWLADIIYFPLETELLGVARRSGQKVANGISMVVGQAAEAFRLITGVKPNRSRMLDRLLAEIAAERQAENAA